LERGSDRPRRGTYHGRAASLLTKHPTTAKHLRVLIGIAMAGPLTPNTFSRILLKSGAPQIVASPHTCDADPHFKTYRVRYRITLGLRTSTWNGEMAAATALWMRTRDSKTIFCLIGHVSLRSSLSQPSKRFKEPCSAAPFLRPWECKISSAAFVRGSLQFYALLEISTSHLQAR
jgi:hypothetical protein